MPSSLFLVFMEKDAGVAARKLAEHEKMWVLISEPLCPQFGEIPIKPLKFLPIPLKEVFMKFTHSSSEFMKVVGIIHGDIKIKALGLEPCCITGDFCRAHVEPALEYCKNNPDFHIISFNRNGYFNRFVEGSSSYGIAEGDPNPHIVYLTPLEIHKLRAERDQILKSAARGPR